MNVASAPFQLDAELVQLDPVVRGPAAAFLAANPAGVGAPLAVVIPAYIEEPSVGFGSALV
jgi:hypothetical protein